MRSQRRRSGSLIERMKKLVLLRAVHSDHGIEDVKQPLELSHVLFGRTFRGKVLRDSLQHVNGAKDLRVGVAHRG